MGLIIFTIWDAFHLLCHSIVEFDKPSDALRAIRDLNDTQLDGRLIFAREDREDTIPNPTRRENPSGAQIFIRNLPFATSWQDLKDHYRQFGNVLRSEVFQNTDGSSKGVGTVLFEDPYDAKRAVRATNNCNFDGRLLEVKIDQFTG